MSSRNFYIDRMTEEERASNFLQMRNSKPGKKYDVLVTHNVTPIIEEKFGPHFRIMVEGSGLYTFKFYHVFCTITPNFKRYGFWWKELIRRCDDGFITFI